MEGVDHGLVPEMAAPAPGPSPSYDTFVPDLPQASPCKVGYTQNPDGDCVPCDLYECALHSECSLPRKVNYGYGDFAPFNGYEYIWQGTENGRTCARGCAASSVPVVGFLPLYSTNGSLAVGTEVACRTCTQLGCPNGCAAGARAAELGAMADAVCKAGGVCANTYTESASNLTCDPPLPRGREGLCELSRRKHRLLPLSSQVIAAHGRADIVLAPAWKLDADTAVHTLRAAQLQSWRLPSQRRMQEMQSTALLC